MPPRNVVLSAHHQSVIDDLVSSGRYQNASEVLREGLRLLEQREVREAAKLKALVSAAQTGFADLDEGHYNDVAEDAVDAFIADLGERAANRILSAKS